MLKADEARATVEFLDRVTIQGHKERSVMNLLVGKLDLIANPPAPSLAPAPEVKDESKDN